MSDLRTLTTSDVFVTGLPGLYYRLLKTDGTSRTLANPHLRTADGLPSPARFGEDVPVPSVTFAPIAAGGVNQQPITVVHLPHHRRQHRDHAADAPRRRHLAAPEARGEQPLGRRATTNLPTFGTRYIETTIRLRDGETNMLAGLIRDDERTTLEGDRRD